MSDTVLENVLRELAALRQRVEALESASGKFAPDAELDTAKGNPAVKFSPRDWRGRDFKGRKYSECSPEFLEVLAESLEWLSTHPKEGKERFAKYDAMDARRARSWARRLRAGWKPPASPFGEPDAGAPGPAFGASPPDGFAPATFDEPSFDQDPFGSEEEQPW